MTKTVLEWLESSAITIPDKIALCDEYTSLTYIQLQQEARSIGSYILEKIGPEKPVVIISGRHVHTLVAYLGVLYSGGYYVPVDSMNPLAHIKNIIKSTSPELILVDKQSLPIIKELSLQSEIGIIDDILNHAVNQSELESARRMFIDVAPMYVIFTSGSTGVPKGVVTSHRAMATFVHGYTSAIDIFDTDVIGSQSPLDYVGVVKDFYTSLKQSATLFIIPKRCFVTTEELVKFLDNYKVSVIAWTVAALTIPVANGAFDDKIPSTLRVVCFTGSVMPSKYLSSLQDKLPQVEFVNLYGPTELTSNCLFFKIKSKVTEHCIIPIGSAFEGYKAFLVNDNGQEIADGEIGELLVGGSALSLGYFNNNELTKQIFIQNPLHNNYREIVYKTGDYCSMQADGSFLFHGRKDRMVKSHGYRIELDEIENYVRTLPEVKNCTCLHSTLNDQLYLYYDGEINEKQLFIHLRKQLPAYKVPRKIKKLDNMPLMNNYKVDINKLKIMMNSEV